MGTTTQRRGGEPRDADTATPPRYDSARWVALAALGAALLTGRIWPTTAPYATALFLTGAVLILAAFRPADRGSKP